MDTFIDIFLYLFLGATCMIIFLGIGDIIAGTKKFPRFTKWWRKHVVSEYPYDDDKF